MPAVLRQTPCAKLTKSKKKKSAWQVIYSSVPICCIGEITATIPTTDSAYCLKMKSHPVTAQFHLTHMSISQT